MADLLRALLRDVLPHTKDAYVIGDADDRLNDTLTELLDERGISTRRPSADAEPCALVIAAGGLSQYALDEHLTWQEACARVAGLVCPGGTLILGLQGESTLATLITSVPTAPVTDSTTPRSATQLKDALRTAGLRSTTVHLLFGDPERPSAVLTEDAARRARPGTLPALAVEEALMGSTSGQTLLETGDALDRAAQVGALDIAATGFVAVAGGRGHDLYFEQDGQPTWAESDDSGRRWVLPDRVLPAQPSVEAQLRAALVSAEVADFRSLADRIGAFVRTDPAAASLGSLRLRHLMDDGGQIGWIVPPTPADTALPADALLADAWWDFMHRLGFRRDQLPWPELTDDVDLVRSWLRMSGADQDAALPAPACPDTRSDQRNALTLNRISERADLVEERLRLANDALKQRDSQLKIRETAVRLLRSQLLQAQKDKVKAERETAALRRGRAYKLARRITLLSDPKESVRVVGNKLDTGVKKIRRMR